MEVLKVQCWTDNTAPVQAKKDRPKMMTLEMSKSIVFVYRVADGTSSLVVVCRKSGKPSVYNAAINHAVSMLDKGRRGNLFFQFTSNFHH